MWLKLRGTISDETIVNRLPLDLDYLSEKNKLQAQNEENMQMNLENMKALGNNEEGADNVGISQFEVKGTEKDISENKQANTKQTAGNNI